MTPERVALITGATGGIGLATAQALAAAGCRLAITGPEKAALQRAAAQLPATTIAIPGDLNDLQFVAALTSRVQESGVTIDLLINNAAWRDLRSLRDIDAAAWEKTLRICLTAPALLARDCAAAMASRGGGVIVNISSIMAQRGNGSATAYVAAKAGLDAVTRDLAVLYGSSGVRVVGVAPGAVDTAISADVADGEAARALRDFSEEMIPLGRWATPMEIARAVVAIASDDMAYLTGTTITLDGGWSAALYPGSLREKLQTLAEKKP